MFEASNLQNNPQTPRQVHRMLASLDSKTNNKDGTECAIQPQIGELMLLTLGFGILGIVVVIAARRGRPSVSAWTGWFDNPSYDALGAVSGTWLADYTRKAGRVH